MTRNDLAEKSGAPTTRQWRGLELTLIMIHLQAFNSKRKGQCNDGPLEANAKRWLIPHIRATSTSKNLTARKLG